MAWIGPLILPVRGQNVHDLIAPEVPYPSDTTPRGDLIVAQALPPSAELVRLGGSYYARNTSGQSLSQLFTSDITQAAAVLWNSATPVKPGDAATCLIIDSVAGANVNSTDVISDYGCYGAVFPPPRPAAYTLTGQIYPNQRPTMSLSAKFPDKSSQSAGTPQQPYGVCFSPSVSSGSPPKPSWLPLGPSITSATQASHRSMWSYDCRGLYIVPPDGLFQFIPTQSGGALTTEWCIRWHEVSLVLG